jgi:cytoskeletal protein CcmA (bactofilin family)
MRQVKERERVGAFLGEDMAFKGLLNFEGTVRLDGKLEGEIKTEDNLVIGETAEIKADISVGSLITKGKVFGNVTAKGKVEIQAGGEVYGNIKTCSLKIEEGAIFIGHCEMIREGGEPIRLPPPAVPKLEGEDQGEVVLYPPNNLLTGEQDVFCPVMKED